MDRKTYDKTTEKEFIGRKVVSLIRMKNGMMNIPAGVTWTIQRKQAGFELMSDPCPHCGIRVYISKVQPRDVEFTDQENLWPGVTNEETE